VSELGHPVTSLAAARLRSRPAVTLLAALGVLTGGAVAAGSAWTGMAVAFAGAFLLVGFLLWRDERGPRASYFVIEAPVLLLLLTTYSISRRRDVASLTETPLDSSAQLKLILVGSALLLGGMAWLAWGESSRTFPLAFQLYSLYVVVVLVGAINSVDPALTLYRGIELAAVVVSVSAAYRVFGGAAVSRLEKLLYRLTLVLVCSVWVGVLVAPDQAVVPASTSPLPWQIQGVYPAIASNGVGTLGVLLAVWSIARLFSRESEDRARPALLLAAAVLGMATQLLAQYRTGYVALAVAAALFLALRGRKALAVLVVAAGLAVTFWGLSAATERAEPLVLRGQSVDQAADLSGRRFFWEHSLPIWRESPLVGGGLLTATRLEVLPSIGYSETATIHGTWVEALVGTGVVGTCLLALALLALWRDAVPEAVRQGGRIVPLALVSVLTVRSLTGSSFESLGLGALLILTLALSLHEARHER
jgi:O-antigen ligase